MFAGHGASMVARIGRIARKSGLFFVGTAVILAGAGCFDLPQDTVVSTIDGNTILLSDIDPILNDTDLTEAEKRQELLDLGVPEDVIDTLLRAS